MTTSALFAALGFVVVVAIVIVWFALAYRRQQEIIHANGLETELEAPQPRKPRYILRYDSDRGEYTRR